jgi:hypothetical protein
MGFANNIGLWALLSLIPFIILYLRKPRPQDRIIPSLMFILQNKKTSQKNDFFQKFLTNILFFLQLLALIGLSLAVAEPFAKIPYDVSLENTVLILDASASMQTMDGSQSRFENAINKAKGVLSGKNSIILAENIPLLIIEEEDQKTALSIIETLIPKATTTNLGDALLLGKDILGDKTGRIVVISDFNSIDGPDLLAVKKAVTSEDILVSLIDVSGEAKNVGIIEMEVKKHNIKVFVKNYNNEKTTIKLVLIKDNQKIAESGNKEILANSVETFLFDDTPTGVSRIELEPEDDLNVDNVAYISAPLKKQIDVLLITNSGNTHLEKALLASKDISLTIVNPPVLTVDTRGKRIDPFSNDVIIMHQFNNVGKRDGILPGTFHDLSNYVEAGGNLIVTSQDDLGSIDKSDLDIVKLNKLLQEPSRACISAVNEITKDLGSQCFSTLSKYYDAIQLEGTSMMASIGDIPIFVFKEHMKGKVFYYGIIDDASDFRSLPSYPIFWNSLVNFMAGTEDISDFNSKTGKVVTASEQRIKTPSSSIVTSRIILDEAGIYEINNKNFAVNLLDADESKVSKSNILDVDDEYSKALLEIGIEKNFSLSHLLVFGAFLLFVFEVYYLKRRGDI